MSFGVVDVSYMVTGTSGECDSLILDEVHTRFRRVSTSFEEKDVRADVIGVYVTDN
jgi:hypothetical protein